MEINVDAIVDKMPISRFSTGHDNWYNPEFVATRSELISEAKDGCMQAKGALMSEPYNIKVLVIDKQIII